MWLRPQFRQLLMGISTRRYLPPGGTAGSARSLVNGKRRVPAPPPMTIANVLFLREDRSMTFVTLARSAGMTNDKFQEFRSSGVQEFRSSGVQEFRSSGVQEFRSSGVQEFRSSGVR